VVGAQVNAHPFRSTQPVQRQRHVYKWFNVGHTHQAKADALGTVGLNAVVLRMQCHCGVSRQFRKLSGLLLRVGAQIQWLQFVASVYRRLGEPIVALDGKRLVRRGER